MFGYKLEQLFFYFIFYCFCGWIIESTYVSVCEKKLTNRGFLRGPVIPIYGCGAMMMFFCTTPFRAWPVVVFFSGMIGCTVLEYFTGWAMESIFKVRYWDYSDKKFNLNGYVSLFTSICWGGCSLIMCYFLHDAVEYIESLIPEQIFFVLVRVEAVIFIVDMTLSFKAAFDLRSLLIRLEKAKDELRLMARRLDVMIAYAGESLDERKAKMGETLDNWASGLEEKMDKASDGFDNRINSLTDSIESKFLSIKKAIEERPQSFAESMKEEFFELKGRFSAGKDNKGFQAFVKEFRMRGMFKGNPTLSSKTFKDSFEFIKDAVTKSENKDKDE